MADNGLRHRQVILRRGSFSYSVHQTGRGEGAGGKRGAAGWSRASRLRFGRRLADLSVRWEETGVSMVTLTFHRNLRDAKEGKACFVRWRQYVRAYLDESGYVWWMEFQARGAVHFHLLTERHIEEVVRLELLRLWLVASRQRGPAASRHGLHVSWRGPGSVGNGAVLYGVKDAWKCSQKVHEGWTGRFWGMTKVYRDLCAEWEEEKVRLVLPLGGITRWFRRWLRGSFRVGRMDGVSRLGASDRARCTKVLDELVKWSSENGGGVVLDVASDGSGIEYGLPIDKGK